MIVTRDRRREYRLQFTAAWLRKWHAVPTDHQTVISLRRLLSEARDLSGRAQASNLESVQQIAIQRLCGEVTAGTRVAFAFRGALAREIRNWIRRAESAIRAAIEDDSAGSTPNADLIARLRYLIDSANVAILRSSSSHHEWSVFCSTADRTEQSAPRPSH